ADLPFDAEGRLLERAEWDRRQGEWLPTEKDRAYVATLQKAVRDPAQIANWIAKPARGINGLPFEYEHGRLVASDTPPPGPPAAGEALVRVRRVGVCGTDFHAFKGDQPFFAYPRVL